MKNLDRRNKYFFGLGTIGRDMFYAFEANALLYFLSNILSLPCMCSRRSVLCSPSCVSPTR